MLRTLVSIAVLASSLGAQIVAPQPISFTGVVQPVVGDSDSVPILCPFGTHTLECSDDVFFTSTTIDLDAYVGQNVKLVGTAFSESCSTYIITEVIDPPPATLVRCGTAEGLGCPFRLRSGPGGISQHVLFVSLANTLIPLGVEKGAFLLGEPNLLLASTAGAIPDEGAAFDFVMPVDVSIIGIEIYFQAARRNVGPVGPIRLSNAVCVTPLGFTLLCHEPDC